MTMSDPIADMLTRIRNANTAKQRLTSECSLLTLNRNYFHKQSFYHR